MLNASELLSAKDVGFAYVLRRQSVPAVVGVNFQVAPAEVVTLNGQSGSGKSTLIALAAGLLLPTQGSVTVLGTDLASLKEPERDAFRLHTIGVVFQDHNLIPQFTALENVLLAQRCQGDDNPGSALALLEEVGIPELAGRRAWEMSGGQRQRVGIARALAGDRKLLLCDEPTGSLDRSNADHIYSLLRSLASIKGVGVVIASHDPIASEVADRVVTLKDGSVIGQ